MRKLLVRGALVCLAATGCRLFGESDFPAAAVQFAPPAYYQTWWQVVEECAGKRTPFDAISWFSVGAGQLVVRGGNAAGAWFVDGNRIVMVHGWQSLGNVVRHEMLHAIIRDGGHTKEYFHRKCADVVACGRDCVTQERLPGAQEVSIDVLEVDASLYPDAPSLIGQDGKATVVVRVRNPANGNVVVPVEKFTEAECAIGFQISMTSESLPSNLACGYLPNVANDARVYFGPGETVSLLFETNLRAPLAFRRPIEPGQVTVSAILANNIRKTNLVTILQ